MKKDKEEHIHWVTWIVLAVVIIYLIYLGSPFLQTSNVEEDKNSLSNCGDAIRYWFISDTKFMIFSEDGFAILYNGEPSKPNYIHMANCEKIRIFCYNESEWEILDEYTGMPKEELESYMSFEVNSERSQAHSCMGKSCIYEKSEPIRICREES